MIGSRRCEGRVGVAIDLVRHRLAAADVIRDVFDVGHRTRSGRNIHAGDVETDAVTGLELVGRREDLDLVLDDLARTDRFDRIARQLVERRPRLGARFVERAVGGLQPAAGQLALGKRRRHIRSPSRAVRTDTSGPTSLSTTIQFVSVLSIAA